MAGPENLEKLLHPQMKYEERVTFETPAKEGLGGVVKELAATGCSLWTMEPIRLQTEIVIHITLAMGSNKVDCDVAAKVTDYDSAAPKPLKGYKIQFNPTNSEAVKQAIRTAVEVKPKRAPSTPKIEKKEKAPAPTLPTKEAPEESTNPESQGIVTTERSKLLPALLAIVVVLGVGVLGYSFLSRSKWHALIPKTIPVASIKQEDADLYVEVSEKWLNSTAHAEQEPLFLTLGREVAKKGIFCTFIVDQDRKIRARILIAVGDRTRTPTVRWQ